MTHQSIMRLSGRMKNHNSPMSHILQALFQADVCEAREVVFGPSCRSRDGEFSWFMEASNTYAGIKMPDGISGTQVREAPIAMTALDQPGQFPEESELVFEIPKSEFILEFQVDEKYETPEDNTWE